MPPRHPEGAVRLRADGTALRVGAGGAGNGVNQGVSGGAEGGGTVGRNWG